LTVTVSLQGSKRPATAALLWFDRAAGVSRDASEPAASLAGMGSLAVGRSKSKKSAEGVPDTIESTRRLMSTLCAESGVPRIFDADGAALSCGKLATTVDRLALAETQAAITRGDLLAAAGALARDGWYFGRATEKTRKQLISAIERASQRVEPAAATTLEARPISRTDEPRLSPLSFDSSGALLVMTSGGVVRVTPDGREENDSAAKSWPLEVTSEGGARWTGLLYACDRNETLLVASSPNPPIVSTLLAPRPGSCRGGAAPKPVLTSPLGWKPNGLEALVALAHVGPKTSVGEAALRPQLLGSPRSPDGRLLVTPMPLGLLVIGAAKPEVWAASSPEWTSLSDCTVANDAKSVACVSAGRALLWRRP
jgi:hypothetical protein